MDIAVYVATTAGPVRVERIVVEDAPLSQVYQGRTYRPLEPVSAAYGDFVGPGGPVEKAFSPFESRSFRLEVSGPIGSGNSSAAGRRSEPCPAVERSSGCRSQGSTGRPYRGKDRRRPGPV